MLCVVSAKRGAVNYDQAFPLWFQKSCGLFKCNFANLSLLKSEIQLFFEHCIEVNLLECVLGKNGSCLVFFTCG